MRLEIHIIHETSGIYKATCPSLPGCQSRGQTYEEAKRNITEAIYGYLAAVSNCVPADTREEVVEYREETIAA